MFITISLIVTNARLSRSGSSFIQACLFTTCFKFWAAWSVNVHGLTVGGYYGGSSLAALSSSFGLLGLCRPLGGLNHDRTFISCFNYAIFAMLCCCFENRGIHLINCQ